MKTDEEIIVEVLSGLKFRDWTFRLGWFSHEWRGENQKDVKSNPYIQAIFMAPDNDDPAGPLVEQVCRKYPIEVVEENYIIRTAGMAVWGAMEHEISEQFTYKGVRVYDPHRKLVQDKAP